MNDVSTEVIDVTEEDIKSPVVAKEYVYDNVQTFENAQRMAKALSCTTLIPKDYQNNVSNCLIALELAQRGNAPILSVMQNLYVVQGRPCWSSQFIIAAINNSGRFSGNLRFETIEENKTREISYTLTKYRFRNGKREPYKEDFEATIQNTTCFAHIKDKSGEVLQGPKVSIEMAYREGWFNKDGSKWLTMPDVMLNYRAAAFFGRIYCPDILMGMHTAEEVMDVEEFDKEPVSKLKGQKPTKYSDLNDQLTEEVTKDGTED